MVVVKIVKGTHRVGRRALPYSRTYVAAAAVEVSLVLLAGDATQGGLTQSRQSSRPGTVTETPASDPEVGVKSVAQIECGEVETPGAQGKSPRGLRRTCGLFNDALSRHHDQGVLTTLALAWGPFCPGRQLRLLHTHAHAKGSVSPLSPAILVP